ncbi:hypothetical protein Tco_0548381 [Tanacetum coccineum]
MMTPPLEKVCDELLVKWKRMELEKDDPNHDCIGEYMLNIDDKDFEYMDDYLFSDNGPWFMKVIDERTDEETCKLVETSKERISKREQEFDEWARSNGFVDTSDGEIDKLVRE